MHMMSHVKVYPSTTYYIVLADFRELPLELYALQLTMGLQQWLAYPPIPFMVSH